jgi:hypothetical protein
MLYFQFFGHQQPRVQCRSSLGYDAVPGSMHCRARVKGCLHHLQLQQNNSYKVQFLINIWLCARVIKNSMSITWHWIKTKQKQNDRGSALEPRLKRPLGILKLFCLKCRNPSDDDEVTIMNESFMNEWTQLGLRRQRPKRSVILVKATREPVDWFLSHLTFYVHFVILKQKIKFCKLRFRSI